MLRRSRAAGLAGCLALIALAATMAARADARQPSPQRFLGVNYVTTPAVSASTATRMRRARVGSVRFSIPWFGVEPQQGLYKWGPSDATIGNLASHGIRPLPVLFGTPRWATVPSILPPPLNIPLPILTPIGGGTAYPPNRNAAGSAGWAQFVTAAALRYGPRGTFWRGPYQREHPGAKPLAVRTWEVWNEPNLAYFFWPEPSAERYAQLLEMSHAAITRADPQARIAMGGLICRSAYTCGRFLDDLYAQRGFRHTFDVVSVHAYAPTVDAAIDTVRAARRVLSGHGDSRTPIWVSEFGWGSSATASRFDAGPQGQATLLREMVAATRHVRRRLGISRLDWFDWQDQPRTAGLPRVGGCAWCDSAGLLDAEGNRKPAFAAFRRAAR